MSKVEKETHAERLLRREKERYIIEPLTRYEARELIDLFSDIDFKKYGITDRLLSMKKKIEKGVKGCKKR